MTDSIEERVIRIIARRTRVDAAIVVPTATLAVLGVASYQGLEITFEIEDGFDINVPLGACDLTVDTVGDMVRAVRAALALASPTLGATWHAVHQPLPHSVRVARCPAVQDELDPWLYAENAEHVYS